MKVPYSWLREFTDCPIGAADLGDRLTMAGLEVESVTRVAHEVGGIVVGRILAVEPHPDADRLSVCRVHDGTAELRIVCGASNMKAGDSAPLARPGAVLPDGTRIRPGRFRGIVSEGMLCSERELGLGEDAAGIMILPEGAAPGTALDEALGLRDEILDINVTPNRPDCMSVIGIAREAAAILGAPLRVPAPGVAERAEDAAGLVRVVVEDAGNCPRYCARVIRGVLVGRSPFPVRHRLGMAGLRPVNNVVDAVNYVLVERGHPLHAFDLGALRGGAVIVRGAREGERIVTIDGKERVLAAGTLVIADEAGPVAVAGVMGGLASEVGAGTRDVLLESAWFNPAAVRRSARSLGLSTESSARFERGADPGGIAAAADRTASLITTLAGGGTCRGIVEAGPGVGAPRPVALRVARLNRLLDSSRGPAEVRACLERLGLRAEEAGRDTLAVTPPSFRVDIRAEIDLVEEVARLEGYDRVAAAPPDGAAPEPGGDGRFAARERARSLLRGLGLSEAVCLSFMGEADMDALMWAPDAAARNAVRLSNPVSDELAYLRSSMLPPLIRCLALNAGRGNRDAMLFEIGTVFRAAGKGELPREEERLAIAVMGSAGPGFWRSRTAEADYFTLKGILETLLAGTGSSVSFGRAPVPSCHPGRSAAVSIDGIAAGWIGEIHPRVRETLGIRHAVVFAEIDAPPVFAALTREPAYRPLPRHPAVRRDIAVVAEEGHEAAAIIECARAAAPGLVESVELFDLFTGPPIPAGKKGVALSVTLRAADATLTEREIEAATGAIREALERAGCRIRTD
ncbi:MAG: phenylalanine--tRNA ligase subunit beta [bacterium]|nr:phenylalanine--tRNA ligase subunit beta [bacterium]